VGGVQAVQEAPGGLFPVRVGVGAKAAK